MDPDDRDRLVRSAAFAWLEQQATLRGEVLPIAVLRQGFVWEGQRVPLMGPQGIAVQLKARQRQLADAASPQLLEPPSGAPQPSRGSARHWWRAVPVESYAGRDDA